MGREASISFALLEDSMDNQKTSRIVVLQTKGEWKLKTWNLRLEVFPETFLLLRTI